MLGTPAWSVLPGLLCSWPRASTCALEPPLCSALEAGNVARQRQDRGDPYSRLEQVRTSHVDIREGPLKIVESGVEETAGNRGIG